MISKLIQNILNKNFTESREILFNTLQEKVVSLIEEKRLEVANEMFNKDKED